MKVIAHISTDFTEKFGVPRQSGLAEGLCGQIVFEPEFRNPDAIRGIEQFSHLWLIWEFSKARSDGSLTVRPPRLGGNTRLGVFATRSPYRPNPIGLSCVRLENVKNTENDGMVLVVSGVDMIDGTPIYDIKPYLPYADSHPEADGGFAERERDRNLRVDIPPEYLNRIPAHRRTVLTEILKQDPRPSYQNDDERVYGMKFAGLEIKFRVSDGILTVCGVECMEAEL